MRFKQVKYHMKPSRYQFPPFLQMAILKKKHFGAVFRAFGYQGHGRHGRLLCLQTWVKGYMTELGLVRLIN